MGEPKALLALAVNPPSENDIEYAVLLLKEVSQVMSWEDVVWIHPEFSIYMYIFGIVITTENSVEAPLSFDI